MQRENLGLLRVKLLTISPTALWLPYKCTTWYFILIDLDHEKRLVKSWGRRPWENLLATVFFRRFISKENIGSDAPLALLCPRMGFVSSFLNPWAQSRERNPHLGGPLEEELSLYTSCTVMFGKEILWKWYHCLSVFIFSQKFSYPMCFFFRSNMSVGSNA